MAVGHNDPEGEFSRHQTFALLATIRSHPASASPSVPTTPLAIAAERYARGEISDEEFARIKRGLS